MSESLPVLEYPVSRPKHTVFNILAIVSLVLGSIIIIATMAFLFYESPEGAVISSVTALIPLAGLIAFYLWLDNYEPEAKSNLLLAFAWGALVATGFALVINTLASFVLPQIVVMSIIAPVGEEIFKSAFLLLMFFWKRGALDGVVDGIVYAGFVAAGFAFVENILYFTNGWIGIPDPVTGEDIGVSGPGGLALIFVLRGLISPFAHPLFTAFAGIGIGYAVMSKNTSVKVFAPIVGIFLAIFSHSLWNSSTQFAQGFGFLALYFFVMIPLFIAYIVFSIMQKRKLAERLWYALHHASQLGLVPEKDIPWLVLRQQKQDALRAAHKFGEENHALVKQYQKSAMQLGFLHHKVCTGVAPKDYQLTASILLNDMAAVRPHLRFTRPPLAYNNV